MKTNPTSTQLAHDLDRLSEQGFLILPTLMASEDVCTLAHELAPWLKRTPRCEGDFHGWRTTRVNGLLSKAKSVQALAMHPRVLAIAEALLAPQCDCVRLNLTQAISIHPGERAQAPHRDEEMWPADPGDQIWSMNAMWAVSEFTPDNGATRLWPGSHRNKPGRTPDPRGVEIAAMKPGSVLLYLGALTHGGGANSSPQDRTGVVVGYCAGWLRTYEEQFLAYPREVAASFDEALQRLVGYRIHRPNLGGWEGQDPIECLRGSDGLRGHRDALPEAVAAQLRAMRASDSA